MGRRLTDPVTAYAEAVVAGRAIASYCVRQASQRHLDDVRQPREKGLVWRPEEARRAIAFFADILILPERTDADTSAPRPFRLEPWQQFIVGSAFGWYLATGARRFRELYVETAKGSGKTPMGAGMMLYLLVADGEYGAQVYIAAVTRDQARLGFVDAEAMVTASPYLRAELVSTQNNLAFPRQRGYLRAISSERRGLDGKRVHGALIDELHEHATPVVVQKMRAAVKGRQSAMIVKITNAGFDRASVCWAHHEYSRKVLDGTVTNESWFAFIAGLDPCDACRATGRWFPADDCATCDNWKVEGPHWVKANPNLGVSLPWAYVRDRVRQAIDLPIEVSDVLRFNFCVWTQAVTRAIDMGQWAACQALPSDDDLVVADAFGCLDLGETDDFSAWGRLYVLPDGRVAVKMRYWLPAIALQRYPLRPYESWRRRGLLTVTEGDVTDYSIVRQTILADVRADGLQRVFYDQRTARETAQLLTAEGVDMVPMAQGFALHEAIKRLLELIATGQLCHGDDEVLAWMASNTVTLTGRKNDKRLAKERAPEKIDGIAALVMGIDGAIIRRERTPPPQYQMFMLGGAP